MLAFSTVRMSLIIFTSDHHKFRLSTCLILQFIFSLALLNSYFTVKFMAQPKQLWLVTLKALLFTTG